MDSSRLVLKAPLSGPLVPLAKVPDPVFAQKLVGDGISIDPTSNLLLAPCDGRVAHVHPAKHAVTLLAGNGLEIMLHVGVDTVSLGGKGFLSMVSKGDEVKAGDALLEFDMDYVAVNAKSLLTQVIVTNCEAAGFKFGESPAKAGIDTLFEVVARASEELPSERSEGSQAELSKPIAIANPAGLHARPAAVLSHAAKSFTSSVELILGNHRCNAKSATAILKLEVSRGDAILVSAKGPDASEAVKKLSELVRGGLGEAVASAKAEPGEDAASGEPPRELRGVPASPGVAAGSIYKMRKEILEVEEYAAGDQASEAKTLEDGLASAEESLKTAVARGKAKESEIFQAHLEMLRDPEVMELAKAEIAKGKSAGYAWQKAFETQAREIASLSSELFAGRAGDMRDVGTRALRFILGIETAKDEELPEGSILVAEELTPSQAAAIDKSKVIGFCTVSGGAASHVAILARALELPALAGLDRALLRLPDGAKAILDANKGVLKIDPSEKEIEEVERRKSGISLRRKKALSECREAAATRDGLEISVVANASGLEDVKRAVECGASGVGLLRTEFLFQGRGDAPSEDEQFEIYKAMAEALGPERELAVRTLDVGGDKPLAYLPIPKEENPFLGERGVRVFAKRPELLRAQIRAALRASKFGLLTLMFPMVSSLPEFRLLKAMVEEERERLKAAPIKIGAMAEVPAVALMAKRFFEEAAFLSIGANDLTQYALAVDRGHPRLAGMADALNPGVLALLAKVAEEGKGRASVCGAMACDPLAIPILIGLGVEKLSVPPPAVPALKALIRGLEAGRCREAANAALELGSGEEVRSLVEARFGELEI